MGASPANRERSQGEHYQTRVHIVPLWVAGEARPLDPAERADLPAGWLSQELFILDRRARLVPYRAPSSDIASASFPVLQLRKIEKAQ
jgi:hypothetical protein